MKLLLGGGGAVIGLIRYATVPGVGRLFFAVVIAVTGFWGPDLLLSSRARRRQLRISVELPDVLDQMTVAVEAGLGFEPAMVHITDHVEGPLSEEFRHAVRDIRLGMSRELAFRGMVDRTDVAELRHFVAALIQADKLGTPLVQVLRAQAAEMRTTRRQRAEEAAQKLPLKMIFPLVLCILPALIMVLIGPAVLQVLDAFPLGQ
jgi:tight adherence protein C